MTGAKHSLVAGDLAAVFLPAQGMLGVSLQHRGEEILRRVDDLEQAAVKGSTVGFRSSIRGRTDWRSALPVAGREVVLDPRSPLLHLDEHGLPMHGVPWARLAWEVIEAAPDRLTPGSTGAVPTSWQSSRSRISSGWRRCWGRTT